jgi:hypothetical protein
MPDQLSLRQLWMTYKEPVIATRYKRVIARHSFYAGAESARAVLEKMLADGEYENLHKAIQQHGQRIGEIGRRSLPIQRH